MSKLAYDDVLAAYPSAYWVLVSGSKMPDAPLAEIERFTVLCTVIGIYLALVPYIAVLGGPPRAERGHGLLRKTTRLVW